MTLPRDVLGVDVAKDWIDVFALTTGSRRRIATTKAALARFVEAFFTQYDKFLAPQRHPKWRDVNLGASVNGWTRFRPAQDWLDSHRQQEVATASDLDRFLGEQPPSPAADKEQVYQAYLKWRQERQRLLGPRAARDTRLSRP